MFNILPTHHFDELPWAMPQPELTIEDMITIRRDDYKFSIQICVIIYKIGVIIFLLHLMEYYILLFELMAILMIVFILPINYIPIFIAVCEFIELYKINNTTLLYIKLYLSIFILTIWIKYNNESLQNLISEIWKFLNKKNYYTLQTSENGECNICLENLPPIYSKLNNCTHIFCPNCIYKWILINPICPTCRRPINLEN